jgi:hypothetical protein
VVPLRGKNNFDVASGAKKKSFLHFQCYNLAIYVVDLFGKFSTHYFNSVRQDPMVGFQGKKIKNILCNLQLR